MVPVRCVQHVYHIVEGAVVDITDRVAPKDTALLAVGICQRADVQAALHRCGVQMVTIAFYTSDAHQRMHVHVTVPRRPNEMRPNEPADHMLVYPTTEEVTDNPEQVAADIITKLTALWNPVPA